MKFLNKLSHEFAFPSHGVHEASLNNISHFKMVTPYYNIESIINIKMILRDQLEFDSATQTK